MKTKIVQVLSVIAFVAGFSAQAQTNEPYDPPYLYIGALTKIDLRYTVKDFQPGSKFSIKGGTIVAGKNENELGIVPDSRKVELTVTNKAGVASVVLFDVKQIPRPVFKCIVNGVELGRETHIAFPKTISVKHEPEAWFLRSAPADAHFIIKAAEVSIVRDTTTIAKKVFAKSEIAANDLAEWRKVMKKGDRLFITVTNMERATYTGKGEALGAHELFSAIYDK